MSVAQAEDSISLRLGNGLGRGKISKFASISYDSYFNKSSFFRAESGFWNDSAPNQNSSTFYMLGIGGRFGDLSGWNLTLTMNAGFVTNGDSALTSGFQFMESGSLGYKNWGVEIRHFSNAGLKQPNLGREYLLFKYTFSLGNENQ